LKRKITSLFFFMGAVLFGYVLAIGAPKAYFMLHRAEISRAVQQCAVFERLKTLESEKFSFDDRLALDRQSRVLLNYCHLIQDKTSSVSRYSRLSPDEIEVLFKRLSTSQGYVR